MKCYHPSVPAVVVVVVAKLKVKVKADTYIVPEGPRIAPQGNKIWITALFANNTISAFNSDTQDQLTTHLSTHKKGPMAELAMLADIQRTVYPDEVTRQLHVMAQAGESSPVIDLHSNHCAMPPAATTTTTTTTTSSSICMITNQ